MVDLYVARASWIHALDPRVKLVWVLCSLIALLLIKNLVVMLAVLILMVGLYATARIPLTKFLSVWKTLLPVAVLLAVLWILFYPSGTPLIQIWIVTITPLSIAQGLVLALRILNLGLAVTLWLYTTDSFSIVQSLVSLHVPYEWGLVLSLALRYIPFIHETYSTIAQAQQARGLNVSAGNSFRRVRVMLPILIATMISTLRASDHLAKALDARGFGARGVHRTSLYELRAQPLDIFLATLLLAGLAVFLWLNLGLGFATQAVTLF